MFELLSRYTPPWLATLLTGLWFAVLIWAIFFALVADGVNFRYWRM
jgi:hypothetical protein